MDTRIILHYHGGTVYTGKKGVDQKNKGRIIMKGFT